MSQILSEYQLVEQLARKTGSSLYLAQSLTTPTDKVVIKVFDTVQFEDKQDLDSFLQEVTFLKQLRHPNILPLLNQGIERGHPYLINTYMSRQSLRERLNASSPSPLPLQEALDLIASIGQALAYAHDWNVLHGNIKTENVLFGEDGEVLLSDFTIFSMQECYKPQYRPGIRSASYMAPEQFTGTVSPASDQYALGSLAYELLTGQQPFTAAALSTWQTKHTSEVPTPLTRLLPGIPEHIESAVLKALAKDPSERHESVAAFVEAMRLPMIPQEHVSIDVSADEVNDTTDGIGVEEEAFSAITILQEIPGEENGAVSEYPTIDGDAQAIPPDNYYPTMAAYMAPPVSPSWLNNAAARQSSTRWRYSRRQALIALTIAGVLMLGVIAIPFLFLLPSGPTQAKQPNASFNSQAEGKAVSGTPTVPGVTSVSTPAQNTPTAQSTLPAQNAVATPTVVVTPTTVPTYTTLPLNSLTPTPISQATPTLASTGGSRPTPTPTPVPAVHPDPTAKPIPTRKPAPTPTSTPTPTPTLTPPIPTPTPTLTLPIPTPTTTSTSSTSQSSTQQKSWKGPDWLRRLFGW